MRDTQGNMSDSQRWLKTATYMASSNTYKGKKGVYVVEMKEDLRRCTKWNDSTGRRGQEKEVSNKHKELNSVLCDDIEG